MLLAAGAHLPGNPARLQAFTEDARKQKWNRVLELIDGKSVQGADHPL
jgi:hypothetical protein